MGVELRGIPGFPHYKASADGLIWSEYSNKFLAQNKRKDGYRQVLLCEDGKKIQSYVHRLVATTFVPNPGNLPQVNHIDENKANNAASNLEWTTAQNNIKWGTRTERMVKTHTLEGLRKSADHARSFRLRKVRNIDTGEVFDSIADACRKHGVKNHANIVNACTGKHHTCNGFRWEYVEEVA